jgi:hypothetical protein
VGDTNVPGLLKAFMPFPDRDNRAASTRFALTGISAGRGGFRRGDSGDLGVRGFFILEENPNSKDV